MNKDLIKKISLITIAVASFLFWVFCAVNIDYINSSIPSEIGSAMSNTIFKTMAGSVGGLIFGLATFIVTTLATVLEFMGDQKKKKPEAKDTKEETKN